MASFTDHAPVFNQYVQQQPVEAMVNVGMHKQQQYDQGLQRIQESYNRVAGLDIMKEGDRKHLKTLLQDNTRKLRGYAAADFSNSQLTNSVTRMIGSVANDETVQNSVFATRKVRTEMSKASDAEKAGKSGVANQWDLNQSISEWLNDGRVGSAFTGSYKQYVDVDKKLGEIYKNMGEEERRTHNPYITDSKGNTMFFSENGERTTQEAGGKPRVSEVMLEQVIKGKSANKILRNFMASLSPEDIQQLQLNGRYHYRNTDPETFKQQLIQHAEKLKETYNKNILEIGIELETNSDLTEANREVLKSALTRYQSELNDGSIDKKLEQQLEALEAPGAIDQYKAQIFTEKYLQEKADAMSNESIQNLIKDNPLWQAQFKTQQFNFQISESIRDQKNKDIANSIAMANLGIARDRLALDTLKLQYDKEGAPLIPIDSAIPTINEKVSIRSVMDQIEEIDKAIDAETNAYINIIELDTPKENRKAILDAKFEAYKMNPNIVDKNPDVNAYMQTRWALENKKHEQQMLYDGAKKAGKAEEEALQKIYDSIPGMSYVINDGGGAYKEYLSARDIMSFSAMEHASTKYVKGVPGMPTMYGSTPGTPGYEQLNGEELVRRTEGTKFDLLGQIVAKKRTGQSLTEDETNIYNNYRNIKANINEESVAGHKRLNGIYSDYLTEKYSHLVDKTAVIDKTLNKKDYALAVQLLNQKINQINTHGAADVYKGNEFDSNRTAEWLKDPSTVIIVKKGGMGDSELIVQNGENQERITILPNEVDAFLPEVNQTHPLQPAIHHINLSPRRSTNRGKGDVDTPTDAYFTGYDLPGFTDSDLKHKFRVDLVGHKDNTGDAKTDLYYMKMYFNDYGEHWITSTTRTYTNIDSIRSQLAALNDTITDNMIVEFNSKK